MLGIRVSSCLVLGWLAFAASTVCGDDFDSLATRLPESTNALMVIDADGLYDSPLGVANQWRERQAKSFAERPTMLPPTATMCIMAMELDIAHVTPYWEVTTFYLSRPIPLDEARERLGGEIDTLGTTRALRLTGGSYIVPFEDGPVAVYRGTQRQWTVQQVNLAQTRRQPGLDPFLDQTIALTAKKQAHIAVAINLKDAVPPQAVAAAVERSTVLKEAGVDLLEAVEVISSMRGFRWTILARDRLQSEVRFEFDEVVAPLRPVAANLLQQVMSMAGAWLPEFDKWEYFAEGNAIGMRGELSVAGLRHVLSLLDSDSSSIERIGQPAPPPAPANPATPAATEGPTRLDKLITKQYAQRIASLVNDIASGKAGDLSQQVLWTDRAAQQISRISVARVDEQVAQLGNEIAADLAEIVSLFHYASDRVSQRLSSVPQPRVTIRQGGIPVGRVTTPFGRYYRYAPFGFAQIEMDGTPGTQYQAISSEELGAANDQARAKFQQIQTKVAKMLELAGQ